MFGGFEKLRRDFFGRPSAEYFEFLLVRLNPFSAPCFRLQITETHLKDGRRSVPVVFGCDCHNNNFVFAKRSCKVGIGRCQEDYSPNFHLSVLTQFFERVVMNSRLASHPIFGVVFGHRQMRLIEWRVINPIDEIRAVGLLRLKPWDFDGWWRHLVHGHVAGMWWNCNEGETA